MSQNNNILSNLNEQQLDAVRYRDGALLVLAGAGSGKTRIITSRIVNMIQQGVNPHEILAVTFTNKAANEMKKRVRRHVDYPVDIGTFHSICLKILRVHAVNAGLTDGFTIYDDQDQLSIIKECMKELSVDEKELSPKLIRERINRAKDELAGPDEIKDDEVYGIEERLFHPIYQRYEEKLKNNNGVDFGDLIAKTVYMFKNCEDILEEYRERYKYILVDEYQDTNFSQCAFINLLAMKYQNITVVGDPDQSIYEWRGANIENILKFENVFNNVKVIRLEQNYRSTNNILKAANSVISHNVHRKSKNLWSEKGEGEILELTRLDTDREEARYLTNTILNLREEGMSLNDIVGFYRTHAQSRVFEEELMRNNIPYRIIGGLKFYARREIKDLVAYLKVIHNSQDEVSLIRIINVPKRGVGKAAVDKLRAVAEEKQISLYEAIGEYIKLPKAAARLKKSLVDFQVMIEKFKMANQDLPISQLLDLIIEDTGYVTMFELENTLESRVRVENIKEFYSSVLEYEESLEDHARNNALQAYLEFICLQTDLDNFEGEDQLFNLMTLHSAKGLEFPVVFMLGMEDGLLPHGNALGGSLSEIEEERRLCYVGFTRAMQKLFLSFTRIRKVFGYERRQQPSRFLYEIPNKLISRSVHDILKEDQRDFDDYDIDIDSDDLDEEQDYLVID